MLFGKGMSDDFRNGDLSVDEFEMFVIELNVLIFELLVNLLVGFKLKYDFCECDIF